MSQSENHPGQENHESNILNIVLLGQAGSGKSASGNTILGTTCFKSEINSQPVTIKCQVEQRQRSGKKFRVIDTPDFFHKSVKNSDTHVEECKIHCLTGSCVYLLVIQIGRFSEGKREILKHLEDALGEIKNQTIVLFTHGENLEVVTFDQFIKEADPHLKEILRLCGDRCHLFRNTSTDRHQVKELRRTISSLAGYQTIPDLQDWGIRNVFSNLGHILYSLFEWIRNVFNIYSP